MRTTIGLLIVYIVALVVGIVGTPAEVRLLALAVVGAPLIIANIIFIIFGRRRKRWSYAGALGVGVIGAVVQAIIGSQPGGGPPAGVTAAFIVLPGLLALKAYESLLEFGG